VSSVRGFLQLATDRTVSSAPTQTAEYLKLATAAVEQLVHLAGDMQDVLSMARQNLHLEWSTFDAVTMLQTILATFQLQAKDVGIQLRCHRDDDVLLLYGDRHRIERILSNLIQNALKFTPSGGSVQVRLERAEDQTVRLIVDDDGPGIADDDLPRLFDLNYQSAAGRRAGYGHGLGLGLAIARMLARAHGGELTALNRPNGGARFTLRLPVTSCFTAERVDRVMSYGG
jgi:signal transduction histidine kinase